MFKLYRPLELSEEFVIGADPGEGVSFCAAVAISKKYYDTPFIFHGRIESSQFGIELYKMGQYIKVKTGYLPYIAIERNTGQATIAKIRDLEYPLDKLYRQKTFDKLARSEQERIGWVTSGGNRRKMLDDLGLSVRRDEIHILPPEIISEMLTFIIDKRTNEPRHEKGKFADLIMATAIGWQIVRLSKGEAKWLPDRTPIEENKKFLPAIAKDFIVEKYEDTQHKDWRSVGT